MASPSSRPHGASSAVGWIGLMACIALVSLLLAAMPFWVLSEPEPDQRVAPRCPDCVRLETLAARVLEQGREAHQRLRRLEKQAGPEAALVLARDDVQAAAASHTVLARAAQACVTQALCAVGSTGPLRPDAPRAPGADHCRPGTTLPEARVRAVMARLRERLDPCVAAACPETDCALTARLHDAVRAGEESLALLARLDGTPRQTDPALTPLVRDTVRLAATVDRLATAFPALLARTVQADGVARAAPLIALRADVVGLAARADSLAQRAAEMPEAPGVWRVRLLAVRLARLVTAFDQLTAADSTARGEGADIRVAAWQAVSRELIHVLTDAARLRLTLDARPPLAGMDDSACAAARQARARDLAQDLAVSAAMLDTCRKRAACSTSQAPSDGTFLPAGGRALAPALDALARLDGALTALDRLATDITVAPSVLPSLTADLARYQVGEAMRVRVEGAETACLREPGASLALIPQTAGGATPPPVPLPSPGTSVLVETPAVPGLYDLAVLAPPARGGAALTTTALDILASPETCSGFSGLWETDFGTLRLVEREGTVRGTYRRSAQAAPGFLTGSVSGRVLTGRWESELGAGGTRLVLGADGRTFRGSWSHVPGELGGTGPWNGRCRLPARP